jgi:di/tricarboxylate transporter
VTTLIAVFVLAAGFERTGISLKLGNVMQRIGRGGEARLLGAITATAALASLVMNNIAAVALLLPAVGEVARQKRLPASRVLLPLAYGTALGGMATLLTTANLIASNTLAQGGHDPLGLFAFAPAGIPLVAAGALYFALFGRRLLPERHPHAQDRGLNVDLSDTYQLRERLSLLRVTPASPLLGATLASGGIGARFGLSVAAVRRAGRWQAPPAPDHRFATSDDLLLIGRAERFDALIAAGYGARDAMPEHAADVLNVVRLNELILSPRSAALGKTVRDLQFHQKFGARVLAIWRDGRSVRTDVSLLPLGLGDSLLVQLDAQTDQIRTDEDFIVLGASGPPAVARPGRGWVAVAMFVLSLLLALTRALPDSAALFLGALGMIVTGCVRMDEAYRAIDWRTIFVVTGLLPLSAAISGSGLGGALAAGFGDALFAVPPRVLLLVVLLSALLLTQMIGGQVAAVIVAPLALALAARTAADPRVIALAVAYGCGMSFLTATSHPANLYVLGPGGYTARDYLRAGLPLTLLSVVIVVAVLG